MKDTTHRTLLDNYNVVEISFYRPDTDHMEYHIITNDGGYDNSIFITLPNGDEALLNYMEKRFPKQLTLPI